MADDTRRSYQQFCGLARALDVIGERWTLLIVRDMLLGPRRYSDLLNGLPGLTTNLLAKRLKQMQIDGLIEAVKLPAPGGATAYQLTALGAALEPVVMEAARWGGRFLSAPREDDAVNVGWGLISLKRRYVGGYAFRAGLRIDDRHFQLTFSPDYLEVRERVPELPDVSVSGALATGFRPWLFMGVPATRLLEAGHLSVSGDPKRWDDLQAALSLPR